MTKRSLAALTVVALVLWATVVPALAQAANPFRDVPADHWAYDAIDQLSRAGLVEGYPDGSFRGERTFTRYEMAMVFARTLARLEALIDERIAGHLSDLRALREQDMKETQAALDQLRRELAERLGLSEEDAQRLWSGQPVLIPGSSGADGEARLSPAAEAAVERIVHEKIREMLAEMPEDAVSELAERVRNGATAEELRELIDRAVAEHLESETGLPADVDALWSVVASETERLSRAIRDLAAEFRSELETLGVRVAELEHLVGDLSRRMAAVEEDVQEAMRRADAAEAAAQRALAAIGEDPELQERIRQLHETVAEAERRAEAARAAADAGRVDEAQEAAREALAAAQRAQETADRVNEEFARRRAAQPSTFTGSIGIDVEMRGFGGTPSGEKYGVEYYLEDPRHDEDDEHAPKVYNRNRISQRFDLRTVTELNEGTEMRGELSLLNHMPFRVRLHDDRATAADPEQSYDGFALGKLDIRLTGDEGQGGIYYGLMNEQHLGGGFNHYVLDPKRFIEPDPVRENHRGLAVDASYRGVSATVLSLDRQDLGTDPLQWTRDPDEDYFETDPGLRQAVSLSTNLGQRWRFGANAVRHMAQGNSDLLASGALTGSIGDLGVGLIVAHDAEQHATAYDATLASRLGTVDVKLNYANVGRGYGRNATNPNEHRGSFLGSGILFQDGDAYSVDVATKLGLLDLRGRYYNGAYYSSEAQQDRRDASVVRFDAGGAFDFLVPLRVEAAISSGEDAALASRSHTRFAVKTDEVALTETVSWNASYEAVSNFDVDDDVKDWNRPNDWENRDKAKFNTRLTWRPAQPLALYVGYESQRLNESPDPKDWDPAPPFAWVEESKNAVALGLNYGFALTGDSRLTLGYEWQKANIERNGVGITPSDRNTISAAFERTLGAGSLRLSAKQITGAGIDNVYWNSRQNAVDRIAALDIVYPLGERFRLNIGGRYVDSRDNSPHPASKRGWDYTATEVTAGLNFDF